MALTDKQEKKIRNLLRDKNWDQLRKVLNGSNGYNVMMLEVEGSTVLERFLHKANLYEIGKINIKEAVEVIGVDGIQGIMDEVQKVINSSGIDPNGDRMNSLFYVFRELHDIYKKRISPSIDTDDELCNFGSVVVPSDSSDDELCNFGSVVSSYSSDYQCNFGSVVSGKKGRVASFTHM